ncbi:MAG: UvrB/UvrC motif-containing protein [Candidatus Omnitrophica bacterium]|nr:UvrB/UvrC motif-containing protein [Candidatus Omnitrophota bacterium]
MKCDICAKNDATVHLTEIVDNKMTKLHLCEECAKKKGAEMEEHFGLSDLLAGLADFGTDMKPEKETIVKCPKCGMTYQDFKKRGRLGCAECYTAFEEHLMPLMKRIHGSSEHFGKSPIKTSRVRPKMASPKRGKVGAKPAKKPDKMDELKARLHRAIKFEEFEEAAKLRDMIRKLEKMK